MTRLQLSLEVEFLPDGSSSFEEAISSKASLARFAQTDISAKIIKSKVVQAARQRMDSLMLFLSSDIVMEFSATPSPISWRIYRNAFGGGCSLVHEEPIQLIYPPIPGREDPFVIMLDPQKTLSRLIGKEIVALTASTIHVDIQFKIDEPAILSLASLRRLDGGGNLLDIQSIDSV